MVVSIDGKVTINGKFYAIGPWSCVCTMKEPIENLVLELVLSVIIIDLLWKKKSCNRKFSFVTV